MGSLRGLRSLITLFTTLPLGGGDLREAAAAFHLVPVIGLIEGVVSSLALYTLLHAGISEELVGATYVILHILITGGIHLDGFADYSDVIGSRSSGERAIAVLKDPRKGSFAIMAIALNLLLSYVSIASIYETIRNAGLGAIVMASVITISYILSAESMYLTLRYAGEEPYEGMAKAFSRRARASLADNLATLLISLLPPLAILFLHLDILAIAVFLASFSSMLLITSYVVRDSQHRMGFANGDVAGFSYELSRLTILIIISVILGTSPTILPRG